MRTASEFGERRTPFDVQAATYSVNGMNQKIPTWSTAGSYWCKKRELSGRELINASQQKSVADFVLETWYDPDVTITPLNRVVINGSTYGISKVDNVDDKNETLLIYCTQTASQPGT